MPTVPGEAPDNDPWSNPEANPDSSTFAPSGGDFGTGYTAPTVTVEETTESDPWSDPAANQQASRDTLKETMLLQKDIAPAQARKDLDVANKLGTTPDIASAAADDFINQQHTAMVAEASSYAPKTVAWMKEDTRNAAAIREDFKKHAEVERLSGEMSTSMKLAAAFVKGTNDMASGLLVAGGQLESRWLNYLNENLAGGVFPELNPEAAEDSALNKFFKENSEFFTSETSSKGFKESLATKDPDIIGSYLAVKITESLPQTLPMIFSAPLGVAGKAAPLLPRLAAASPMGFSTFGNKMQETRTSGASEEMRLLDAGINGAAEVVFEAITLGAGGKLGGLIEEALGKAGAKKALLQAKKAVASTLGELILKEAGGEMATQAVQSVADVATGVNPDAMKGIGWQLAEAGTLGFVQGGTTTSAGFAAKGAVKGTVKGLLKAHELHQIKKSQALYDESMQQHGETALHKETPDSGRTLLQRSLEGAFNERIQISSDKFDEVLRANKLDPAQVAEELGVGESYKQSKAGSVLNIENAAFIAKFANTPMQKAFRDHFTFQSLARTKAEQTEMDKAEEATAPEESTPAAQFKKQLEEAGVAKASEISHIFGSWLNVREALRKVPGAKLMEDAALTVSRKTGIDALTALNGIVYHPQLNLNPEEQDAEAKLAKAVDTETFAQEYFAKHGNVISPKKIQKESAEFVSDPLVFHSATIEVARKKAHTIFAEQASRPGTGEVTINSGASGTGSHHVATGHKGGAMPKGLMLDSVLTDFAEADAIIQAAIKAGNPVSFIYTEKPMFSSALQHRTEAFHGEGLTPADAFVMEHIQALEVAIQIAEKYADHKGVHIELQTEWGGNFNPLPLDDAKRVRYIKEGMDYAQAFEKYRPRVEGVLRDAQRQIIQAREWRATGNQSIGNRGPGVPEVNPKAESWTPQLPTAEEIEQLYANIGKIDATRSVRELKRQAELKRKQEEGGADPLKQGGDGTPLGAFSIRDGKSFIDLFAGSNFSTIVHEMAHFFHFEAMKDYAAVLNIPEDQREPAQVKFLDDMDSLAKELGADDFLNMSEEHMEKWARSFETYITEGKAPSKKLRNAFNTLKVWMLQVYRNIRNIKAPINDEIRGIFDRMLATEEEIQAAQEEANPTAPSVLSNLPLPTTAAIMLEKAIAIAKQSAIDHLAERALHAYTRAFNKNYREITKAIELQVEKEVGAMPVYQRLDNLMASEAIFKIDAAYLDAEVAKGLPRGIMVSGMGLNPEQVAVIQGYSSSMEMIEDFKKAPPKSELIAKVVAERIKEIGFVKLTPSDELRDLSRELIRDADQDAVYRTELEILAKEDLPTLKNLIRKVTAVPKATEAVQKEASVRLDNLTLSEINPDDFVRSERTARALAGKLLAKGDIDGCFQAIEDARLHMAMYRQARTAQRGVVRRSQKLFHDVLLFSNKKGAKRRDADMAQAAKAVLASFGLERKGKSPIEYMRVLQTYNADLYATIQNELTSLAQYEGMELTSMPFRDYKRVSEVVTALWNQSRAMHEATFDGRKLDMEDLASETIKKLTPMMDQPKKGAGTHDRTWWENKKLWFGNYAASMVRMETLCSYLDGKGDNFFHKLLYLPVKQAATRMRLHYEMTLGELKPLVDAAHKLGDTGPIVADELTDLREASSTKGEKHTFANVWQLMGYMQHMGNESNLKKMLLGKGWASIDEETGEIDTYHWDMFMQRMMDTGVIRQEHMDLLQAIGDAFEKIKPLTQEAHHKLNGYYFEEIPAKSFEAFGKTYRGWYVPVQYDPNSKEKSSAATKAQLDMEILQLSGGAFAYMNPTKGMDGFTQSRAENYVGPVLADLSLIPMQLNKALRYAYIVPEVDNVAKLLARDDVKTAIGKASPYILDNVVYPFLLRAATQRVETPSKHGEGEITSYMRAASSMGIMMGNGWNAAQQATGFGPAAVLVSKRKLGGKLYMPFKYVGELALSKVKGKVKPEGMRDALYDLATDKGWNEERILAASEFMRTLSASNIAEMQGQMRNIFSSANKFQKAQDWSVNNMYFMQSFMQNMVNYTVWPAAYDEAVVKHMNHEDAVQHADRMVRETQGTPFAEDIADIETGGPMWRLLTQFSTYFMGQANLIGKEMLLARKDNPDSKVDATIRAAYVYGMGVTLTALLSDAIMNVKFSGDVMGEADEEDGWKWNFMSMLFTSSTKYTLAMLPPGLRNVAMFAYNNFGDADRGQADRVQITPFLSNLERFVRSARTSVKGKKDTPRTVQDIANLAGLATKLPLGPAAKLVTPLLKPDDM